MRSPTRVALLALLAAGCPAHDLGPDARPSPIVQGVEPFRRVVRSLAVYRGELFFGTYGSGLFRRTGGRWRQYLAGSSGLSEDRVNCLAVHQQRLYVGTCGGIDVFGPDGFEEHIRAGPDSVAHDIYHVVRELAGGGLWVGTTGKGLSQLEGGRWRSFGRPHGLLDLWVNDVHRGDDGVVWVGTSSGLYAGPPGAWREHRARGRPPPLESEVTALAAQGGTLWIGTAQAGLWGVRDGAWIEVPRAALPAAEVLALAVDHDQRLWVGTRRGLASYRFDEGFRAVAGNTDLAREEVKVLDVDPEGILRLGTFRGRVYERSPSGGFRRLFDPDFPVVPEDGPPGPGRR